MKLVICGKGGCGKSTITTLLGKELASRKRKVLIVDGDESNFGLHKQLGMDVPKDFSKYFGTRNDIMQSINHEEGQAGLFAEKWKLTDIPEEYVFHNGGISLMASGKIHDANEGCGCAAAKMLGVFMEYLDLKQDEDLLLDMEAGVEHFGRGTDNSADAILMIVDPSFESVELSHKVKQMAESIHKPVYFILNKMDEETSKMIMDKIPEGVACVMPAEKQIMEAGLLGEEQLGNWKPISKLTDFLLDKIAV